jgi:hypothetical protein
MEWFDKAVGITWLVLTYQQNRILARGNPPQNETANRLSGLRQRFVGLARYWPTLIVVAFGGIYFGRSLIMPPSAGLSSISTPAAAASPVALGVASTPVSESLSTDSGPPPNPNEILAAKGLLFSPNFAQNLSRELLRLPRPCTFKLIAPKSLIPVRDQLVSAAMNSSVPDMENSGATLIAPCTVIDEQEDRNPELYGRRDFPDLGIVIHSSDQKHSSAKISGGTIRFAINPCDGRFNPSVW